ncbi:MAG: hypothetical protein IT449_01750 [Phycisphaerales bacterium]|nr:hypothetical protein [Phycisphaerales bacterium]
MKKKSSSANHVYAEPHGRSVPLADTPDRPFHELRKLMHNGLAILSLRRWVCFFPFCIATAGVFLVSLNYPRVYTASTRFERRDDPVLMDLPTTEGTGSFSYFRQTLERDIVAVDAMAEVVDKLGLVPDITRDENGAPTPDSQARLEAMGRAMAGTISLSGKERTPHLDLIEVRYTGPDPSVGARLVDQVKNTYIERTQQRIRALLDSKKSWYVTRLAEGTQRLTQAQKDLSILQMENPYIDPRNPGSLNERIEDLTRERREFELARRTLEIDLSAQEQLLRSTEMRIRIGAGSANRGASLTSGVLLSVEAVRIANEIKRIVEEMDKLKTDRGMREEHPQIVQLNSERARLEEKLQTQRLQDQEAAANESVDPAPATLPEDNDPTLVQWRQENDRVKIQIESYRQQLQEIQARCDSTDAKIEGLRHAKSNMLEKQEAFARCTSEVDLAAAECGGYRDVLGRIEPILTANEQGRAVTFTEDQPARGSSKPIAPETKTVMIIALLIGACAGVIGVVMAEVIDHVFRNSHQVARSIGLSILETIDVIVTTADRRRNLVRRLVLAPTAIAVGLFILLGSASVAYLSIEYPAHYESLRSIPRSIMDHVAQRPGIKLDSPSKPESEGVKTIASAAGGGS